MEVQGDETERAARDGAEDREEEKRVEAVAAGALGLRGRARHAHVRLESRDGQDEKHGVHELHAPQVHLRLALPQVVGAQGSPRGEWRAEHAHGRHRARVANHPLKVNLGEAEHLRLVLVLSLCDLSLGGHGVVKDPVHGGHAPGEEEEEEHHDEPAPVRVVGEPVELADELRLCVKVQHDARDEDVLLHRLHLGAEGVDALQDILGDRQRGHHPLTTVAGVRLGVRRLADHPRAGHPIVVTAAHAAAAAAENLRRRRRHRGEHRAVLIRHLPRRHLGHEVRILLGLGHRGLPPPAGRVVAVALLQRRNLGRVLRVLQIVAGRVGAANLIRGGREGHAGPSVSIVLLVDGYVRDVDGAHAHRHVRLLHRCRLEVIRFLLLVRVIRELKLGPGSRGRLVDHRRLHSRGHAVWGTSHRVRDEARAEPLRQRDLLLDATLLLLLEGGGVVAGEPAGFQVDPRHRRGVLCRVARIDAAGFGRRSAHGGLGGIARRAELGHQTRGGLLESPDDVQGLAQLAAAILGFPDHLAALDAGLDLGDVAGRALGLVRGHRLRIGDDDVGGGGLLRDRGRGGERGGEGGDGRGVGREPVEGSGLGGPGHEHAVHLVRVRGGAV